MISDWHEVTIEEIKDPAKYSIAMGPFGSNIKTDNFVESGVPVIRGVNLNAERFLDDKFVYLTEQKADELRSANAFPGDIIFTHRGTLGQVGIIPLTAKYKRYVVSQSQMKLQCDPQKAYAPYVFYYFKSPIGQQALLANTSTTGVPAISSPLTSLRAIRIPLPPLPQQHAIAGILSALDDKIELNRRMNATLEAIARAVFHQWFVENDDVENWESCSLGDMITTYDSKRVPLSNRERTKRPGKYPYYGAASIMDYIDGYLFDGIYILMAEDGSVVDDNDHPVIQYVWGKFWVNNHAHVLQGINGICSEYLYLFLKDLNILPYVTGAVQLKLNQANMNMIPFVKPPSDLCKKFEEFVAPIFSLIRANKEESLALMNLRDALLPKLMRGEIRLKELA